MKNSISFQKFAQSIAHKQQVTAEVLS